MKPSARSAFVDAEVVTAVAHQIRVIRQQRGWSQSELAKLMGTTQTAVSRLEDPSYGRIAVSTLLALARVFDTGLAVKFVSLVDMIKDTWHVSRNVLEIEAFADECKRVIFTSDLTSSYHAVAAINFRDTENHAVIEEAKMLSTYKSDVLAVIEHVKNGRGAPEPQGLVVDLLTRRA